jgi:uncharacterized protein (TIGR03435 family)
MRSERFDIEATAPAGAFPPGLSEAALKEKQRLMLQKLLEDRFQLKMVREQREMPVYAIAVARDGLKLPKSTVDESACAAVPAPTGPGSVDTMPCHEFLGGQGRGLHGRAVTIEDIARYVENWAERPVIDKTNLHALYRVETEPWIPMSMGLNPPPDAKGESGALLSDMPTLFEVFQRMGLRLDSQKDLVDVFRIDRPARPSEN